MEKRVPFSYSTFVRTQAKAVAKAKREGKTVSTVIHEHLQDYTKDEPDPLEHPPADLATNTEAAAAGNQPENTTAEPQAVHPENTSNDGESLQPHLEPETETAAKDPVPTVQPGSNTASEPVEAAHAENNTAGHEPLAEGKTVPPVKKKSPAGKSAKKASSDTVKKSPSQKALKKVTPKPSVTAKKKNQAGKSKKSKAKS